MADIPVEAESLDGKFVASISQILNNAGVPNLLWGNYLLTVYGVPTIVDVRVFLLYEVTLADSMVGCGFCSGRRTYSHGLIRAK